MDDDQLRRVSPRARLMWMTSELIQNGVLLVIVVVLTVTGVLADPWSWLLIALAAVPVVLGVVVVPWWRYRVHKWGVGAESVVTQRGWLNLERREAPLNRVQTVDVERGPLAQLFGLSEVTVTTASSAGRLRIQGLDRATAERLVDELTMRAALAEDDAT